MEIEINQEVLDYKESLYFGMTVRQCVCTVVAVVICVVLFMNLKPALGMEAASWVCVLAALPVAAIGFVNVQGKPLEQFVLVFLRYLAEPKQLTCCVCTWYQETMADYFEQAEKEEMKRHD